LASAVERPAPLGRRSHAGSTRRTCLYGSGLEAEAELVDDDGQWRSFLAGPVFGRDSAGNVTFGTSLARLQFAAQVAAEPAQAEGRTSGLPEEARRGARAPALPRRACPSTRAS
jgi:hypothetical protein